jgi:WD40 repeat protein
VPISGTSRSTLIQAHKSTLAYLSLSSDASKLASASETGTLVRVWDTKSSSLIYEGRRGSDFARIQCINFDVSSKILVVSSDKETVHVFKVGGSRTAIVKFRHVKSGQSSECVFLEASGGRRRVLVVYGDGGAYIVGFEEGGDGSVKKEVYKILK